TGEVATGCCFALAGLAAVVAAAASAAPPRTVIAFAHASAAPAGTFSSIRRHYRFGVTIAARGHRVTALSVNGREHVLVVAPTAEGGFCTSLTGDDPVRLGDEPDS